PSQMGLLKVFDQRNTELMTRPSRHVNDVSYFASSDKTSAPVQSSPEPLVAVADNANEESSNQADLTGYIKELYNNTPVKVVSLEPIVPHLTDILKDVCNLSPEQVVEVQPIVASFEAKRDSIYKIYKNDDDNLSKQVRTNRLNYEVALLDVLSLDQMRTVRAFNLSNRELIAGSGTTVNKIEFLPEAPSAIVDAQPDIQPSASDKTTEVATSESTLTIELKDLCDLTPEQVAKAEPIIADFEKKRDETYKKYRHNPTELKKMVKQNRWDYEVAMIGTLNPSQMGLLKVFDQRNTELMTRPSTHIHDVKYFADAK
ncbi:MAG TPA: hypothetical protein VK808_12825, partial [Bacteroidia bacterium]|nr:hypothetical protein [Bacteroidia bacterium]